MFQCAFAKFNPGMGINRQGFRTGIARFPGQSRGSAIRFASFLESTCCTKCTGTHHLGNQLALGTELTLGQGPIRHFQGRANTSLSAQNKGFECADTRSLFFKVRLSQAVNQGSRLTELPTNRMNPAIDDPEPHAPFQQLCG